MLFVAFDMPAEGQDAQCRKGVGATQFVSGQIRKLQVPLPPNEAQERFADTAAYLRLQAGKARQHPRNVDSLVAALRHQAIRGELQDLHITPAIRRKRETIPRILRNRRHFCHR
jgi:hypothetical protein